MNDPVRKFRVFVASPGDVKNERRIARDVVHSLSHRLGDRGGFVLEPVGWETHAESDAGRAQALLNPLVRECDVFVGILWSRFGTETGVAESGTAEEFAEAAKRREQTGDRPTMMVFFSDAPVPMERLRDPEGRRQLSKTQDFRTAYDESVGLSVPYRDANDFERNLREQLEAWCAKRFEIVEPSPKRTASHSFPAEYGSYADALRQEIKLASFIGPPTSEAMHRPEVETVYVPVSVEAALHIKNDVESLRAMDRRTTFALAWDDWKPAKHGPMVILGGPGAGKTTLLKHLGLRALDASAPAADANLHMPEGLVPVFIRLAKLDDVRPGIPSVIAGCPPQVDQGLSADFFSRAVKEGRCLLLLDGLDEAADHDRTAELSRWVERIWNNFKQNRIVLSSRYVGYREDAVLRVQHRRVSLVPLGDEDIPKFLAKWYSALEAYGGGEFQGRADDLTADLTKVLLDPERSDLRSLAGTPLMLLIMALLHRTGKGLPARRVDLYNLCVDVLLEHWNKETGRPYISAPHGRAVLRPLAFWLHSQARRFSATADELAPIIGPELERTPSLPERDPVQFLNSIRDRFGLFTGQSQNEYAFLHPSFQEYLAAEHVKNDPGAIFSRRRKGRS